MQADGFEEEQLWRLETVLAKTGLSRTKMYEMIECGEFPEPVPLSVRCVAWVASEVNAFIRKCISKRDEKQSRSAAARPRQKESDAADHRLSTD